MGLFDRLFGGNVSDAAQPKISFGRYTDSYKSSEQYDAWDRSLEKFEAEAYLESYKEFFTYLRDEDEDNVIFREEKGGIHFELYQGSKKIIGFADHRKVRVEAPIAHSEELNLGFMRRLIENNFDLKYGRFALDKDNTITIRFDTYTIDGSPYKLYYALKEAATHADKQDDLLLDEFGMLEPVETKHLRALPQAEKEAKYNYIISEAKWAIDQLQHGKLNADQYPGGIAYLLLNVSYKLDYLTKPEGFMMESLERLHRLYFAKDNKAIREKIANVRKEYEQLIDRPKEEYFKEMYLVRSTFGITSPVNHDRVKSFIDGELPNMDWYKENGYDDVALSVPGYIVGYCLFNYAIPQPDRDFFHLYYHVVEADYFKSLGYTTNLYNQEQKTFNKKGIKKAIKSIVDKNKKVYPNLSPAISSLDYTTICSFSKTYLLMVYKLDMTKLS